MHTSLMWLAFGILLACISLVTARAVEVKGCGTCFAITRDGICLTNAHVVRGATKMKILADGKFYTARVVAVDEKLDLALVKSLWEGAPLRLRNRDDIVLGTKVWMAGFPRPEIQGLEIKVTEGIISSLKGAMDYPIHYQHSAASQPGNSGGPLFDDKGAVVGIVVAKLDGDFQNVNYAIKAPVAYEWLTRLPALVGKSQAAVPDATSPTDAVHIAVKATAMLLVEASDEDEIAEAPPVTSRSQATRKSPPQPTATAVRYSQSSKKASVTTALAATSTPPIPAVLIDGEPCKVLRRVIEIQRE
ncbi:MAG: trypsin-like peptidase protein [Verrucomicrobiaceae bacterium]|nr:trypsin-like peptidase protein [Verrucomicrobiaceae bacterium]